jgi:hypothetical protein
LHDLFALLSLSCNTDTFFNEVKFIAFFSLFDNKFTSLELLLDKCI